jgi:uncharacterized membrane protein
VVKAPGTPLFRALETVLTVGLLLSAALLLAGLALGSLPTLRAGTMLLILTPVARVLAVTIAFVHAHDWTFALLSLAVLGVLGASAWAGLGAAR